MKKSIFLVFSLSFVLFSLNASASLLIEPYAGYSFKGESEITYSNTTLEGEYSSPTIGGRLGLEHMGLMMGLDYSAQSFDLETKAGSTTYKDAMKKTQMGIFLGYNFPFMFRFWGTFFFSGKLEGDDPAGSTHQWNANDKFSDGSGFALGIGYKPIPYVSLNLEYRTIEYGEWKRSGVEITNVSSDQKLDEILFSISLPITVF